MKNKSNSQILMLLMLAAFTLISLPGRAQEANQLKAKVPFDFMIGRFMFPAGEYTLQATDQHSFLLQACHGRASLIIDTRSIHRTANSSAGRLVFDHGPRHYHLIRFWVDSANGARLTAASLPTGAEASMPRFKTVAFISPTILKAAHATGN